MREEDDESEEETIPDLPKEMYRALAKCEAILYSGSGWMIRHGDDEVQEEVRQNLTQPGTSISKEFAAYIAAHMFSTDQDVREELKKLSQDESLRVEDRLWFYWALEHAKSND